MVRWGEGLMAVGGALVASGIAIAGLNVKLGPIKPQQGSWIALFGLILLLVGFLLFVLGKGNGGHRQAQKRGDGPGDQYQARRDIHVDNRLTPGPHGETTPLIQIKERGELVRGAQGLAADFPMIRIVNRDPHRHISATLQLRTYNEFGTNVGSYPHTTSIDRATSAISILPPVIELGEVGAAGRFLVEGAAWFPLGAEDELPAPHLWVVLVDRVDGRELAKEYAEFDPRG